MATIEKEAFAELSITPTDLINRPWLKSVYTATTLCSRASKMINKYMALHATLKTKYDDERKEHYWYDESYLDIIKTVEKLNDVNEHAFEALQNKIIYLENGYKELIEYLDQNNPTQGVQEEIEGDLLEGAESQMPVSTGLVPTIDFKNKDGKKEVEK